MDSATHRRCTRTGYLECFPPISCLQVFSRTRSPASTTCSHQRPSKHKLATQQLPLSSTPLPIRYHTKTKPAGPEPPKPSSATTLTLSITELLEHILSFLPPLNIYACNPISRAFHACIQQSPLLRHLTWRPPLRPLKRTQLLTSHGPPFPYYIPQSHLPNHLNPIIVLHIERYLSSVPAPGGPAPIFNISSDGEALFTMGEQLLMVVLAWGASRERWKDHWAYMPVCRPGVQKMRILCCCWDEWFVEEVLDLSEKGEGELRREVVMEDFLKVGRSVARMVAECRREIPYWRE
ncbi:hypothetical protein CC78DRAFT_573526 [Lojkania enalia]|uniref:F-box domain-containing protein n=1 Tax=Lojkania enalia TaxID=147567 RepID=A0A9P4TS66_9PLEO|nr:hypothetical protein CC78DRAFT_573526 [Didymosphaeria enalia]